MSHVIDQLLTNAPPALIYLLVFLIPALEASVFVGFVLPGETAVLLGGAIASQSRVHLSGVIAAAILGAVIGDTVGYLIGRRFGGPLQESRLGRVVGERRWRSAEDFLRRRGGPSVFLGRWTALLRALVPAAAGMAKLPYHTFAIWNISGGLLWATAISIAGFLAGNAYHRLEKYIGDGALALLAVIIAVLVVRHVLRERRNRSPVS
ncbi:MAG: DedA family protein [Streptosporangiaceae bacterium]